MSNTSNHYRKRTINEKQPHLYRMCSYEMDKMDMPNITKYDISTVFKLENIKYL